MVLMSEDVPLWLAYGSIALLLLMVGYVCQDKALLRRMVQIRTVFLLLLLLFLWALSVNVSRGASSGLSFHLLGMTLAFLMLQPKAALGLLLVLSSVFMLPTVWQHQQWLSLAPSMVLTVLPAWLVNVVLTPVLKRYLPKHVFVFILGHGFVTAGISMLVTGMCITWALHVTGRYSWYVLSEEVLPVYVLLMWGEGFLTGLLVAVMVAFKPHWLDAYSDAVYLPAAPVKRW